MTFCHKKETFLSQKRAIMTFLSQKIYYYPLIDSFWGFPGLIDSPTSYAALPTPLSIFGNWHKCANQSDCLLWNLFLECYCSERMRARRMVVRSFFRALLCPITFAVWVRWHLSMQSLTLHCDPLWICADLYICDPLRTLGRIIEDLRN